ncbi:MAG: AraC family transcriptional regulator [Colwellia sp.]|nr:AraC family transcriptional regulator [Colwellia sp.]
MKYQENLCLVLTYIEHHLNEDLPLDKLSAVACLSKFHFQRQFSQYFGISTTAYIKALRLKQAGYQLAFRNDKKVIDIAFEQNYESSEAFSRAFKKFFAVSPIQFRKSPPWFPWQEKLNLLEKLRKTMKEKNISLVDNTKINVEIVDFPAINIAAYQHRRAPYLLGDSIRKFITWRKQHKLSPKVSRTFNLVYDDPATTKPEDYRFDLCAQLPLVISSTIEQSLASETAMTELVIPAGKCAKVRHIGSDEQFPEIIGYLYGEWLTRQKVSLRDFPLFFERVSFYPDVSEHEMITDIYLPLA